MWPVRLYIGLKPLASIAASTGAPISETAIPGASAFCAAARASYAAYLSLSPIGLPRDLVTAVSAM